MRIWYKDYCVSTSRSGLKQRGSVWILTVALITLGALQPAFAAVLINEIHYNPDVKTELVEFVELYNSGTTTVNVSGWQLADGVAYTIPAGTQITAGGYLVIAQNPTALKLKFGTAALGPWSGLLSNDGDKITLRNAAGGIEHQVTYQCGFPWPTVGDPPGYSIQLANSAFDTDLGGNWRGAAPTPGLVNSVLTSNLPPQIRQVDHSPSQPTAGQRVTITAKVTDPEGVQSVQLQYQVVTPGNYIELTDPAYSTTWTTVPMNDGGTNGDAMMGDSIYTAVLPANIQQHRNLVRYRIVATDSTGLSVTAPYADDPQPNFAYFCYNGVPAWQGATMPGTTAPTTFDTNIMRRFPAVHLISKMTSVRNCTWLNPYWGSDYPWAGTIVFDGKVYDHIRYRARGGCWRYAMVKNMWKFDFNRGHNLEMSDDYRNKYSAKWKKLNLGACIQQGDYGHRGEQGMFESVGFRMFNLMGVAASRTTFLQFRVVDNGSEYDPSNQYEGDFWGLYLGVEQVDGRFLDDHGLPDGNLYKMENGTGTLNNEGLYGPTDNSDLSRFQAGGSLAWWKTNLNIAEYVSYRTVVEGMHHYDIGDGKNYDYYHNPVTALWSVHPWDLDLTWADNMYGSGNEPFKTSVLPQIGLDYKNRIREVRDLFFNSDQAGQLIDEMAGLLRGSPGASPSFLDADRAMWDYNPKMAGGYSSAQSKAGTGRFYQWPNEPTVSKSFEGCVQLMKNYVTARSAVLDGLATDINIPTQPTITYTGPQGFPLNKLSFQCGAYKGTSKFAAMKWRVAEVAAATAPSYDFNHARPYEITPVWESAELSNFTSTITFPVTNLVAGHTYRARLRMKDTVGRWSQWSQPVSFVAAQPDTAGALVGNLRITELMYNPPAGSDYEFIELHNISSSITLDLTGASFRSGVDFTFPAGVTIPPNGYLVVMRNPSAAVFRSYYGISDNVALAGPYSGSLANEGEQLTLKTSAGGTDIFSFTYGNGRGWPQASAGGGHSLTPVTPDADGQATGALDYPGNWKASVYMKGSPGRAEPTPPSPTILLNEIAANTDSDPAITGYVSNDWIELYNTSGSDINLTGWYLSDDPANLKKWAIPATTVAGHSWVSFDEITGFHNPPTNGFGLDKTGEQVLLSFISGSATDRVVDEIAFKGQENNVTLGRFPDGAPYWQRTTPTRNGANALLPTSVAITEVMYHPPDLGTNDNTRDEYIKISNPTDSAVVLQDTNGTWRLAGGISFTFPTNTVIAAGGSLLVVGFAPTDTATLTAFRSTYHLTNNTVPILGPYSGKLNNRGDHVSLEKPKYPEAAGLSYWWILLDEAIFGNQSPWPFAASGNGASLQRISVSQSANDPANWVSAAPNPGNAIIDTDGDGMPDQWEISHYLNPADPSDAAVDSDGDGLTNLQEYLCGTDPRDASSTLKFDSAAVSSAGIELKFTALPAKSYTILVSDSMEAGSWQKFTNIAAGAKAQTTTLTAPHPGTPARYFRLVTPALP